MDNERTFVHLSRAWYGPANLGRWSEYIDEVCFSPGRGELMMRWYQLGKDAAPRLEVFDDSWIGLWECKDVLEAMAEADSENIDPGEFCQLLLRLGFRDETPVDDERQADLERKVRELVAQERAR